MQCTLESDEDGPLWQGEPNATGLVELSLSNLSLGEPELTLTCEAEDQGQGRDSVRFSVADMPPELTLLSPTSESTLWAGEPFDLAAKVRDDLQATEHGRITLSDRRCTASIPRAAKPPSGPCWSTQTPG